MCFCWEVGKWKKVTFLAQWMDSCKNHYKNTILALCSDDNNVTFYPEFCLSTATTHYMYLNVWCLAMLLYQILLLAASVTWKSICKISFSLSLLSSWIFHKVLWDWISSIGLMEWPKFLIFHNNTMKRFWWNRFRRRPGVFRPIYFLTPSRNLQRKTLVFLLV